MPKISILNYLSLVKFSHTVFAMPFAIIGYLMAIEITQVQANYMLLAKIIACMVFTRNAAMAFNRYADRKFDLLNPRTFAREIPSGIISETSALVFVILNIVLFVVTTFFINRLCFYLSPVALAVVLGYSYTKRFTALCHFILGLGLSLAPLGAFMAVTGNFHIAPVFLSLAVMCWVGGFDIIYALQDDDFDKANQLNSIPVKLGRYRALKLARWMHFFAAIFLLFPALYLHPGLTYYLGWLAFIGFLIFQHSLVKVNDLTKVNLAFFTSNGIAGVSFMVFFITDYFISK